MRRLVVTSLFAFVASLAMSFMAQGQQFTREYFPLATLHPAIQFDFNGDGIPDFLAFTTDNEVTELLSSDGTYISQHVGILGTDGGYPIASGDFNNDGKADVIFFNPLGIAYGNGQGGFTTYQSIFWSGAGQQVNYAQAQVADFNGDGKPDLAIGFDTVGGSSEQASFQVVIFINNGKGFNDGVTVYVQPVLSGSNEGFEYTTDLDLLLGDFDADGHADLGLRTTESDPNNPGEPFTVITALYGNGKGGFTPLTVNSGSNFFRISAADMNNDGTSDIVGDFTAR